MIKEEITPLKRTIIFITLMLGASLSSFTASVTTVMVPKICVDLNVTVATAQWLTSASSLASGVIIPIAAWLMKRLKTKVYFLLSVFIFCLGSVLASLSSGFGLLLTGRVIQSIGCGFLMPFTQVVLMGLYKKENYGTVMGVYALATMISPIIAPTVTGLIIDFVGWQTIFVILSIIGAIVLLCGTLFIVNVNETEKAQFNLLHVIISSIGFIGIVTGLGNVQEAGLISLQGGGALLVGIIFLLLFIYLQLNSSKAMLNLRVFKNRDFTFAFIVGILSSLICMGSGTLLPVIAQNILGNTATEYALYTLPGMIIMALSSFVSGRIYDKFGGKTVLYTASGLMLVGCVVGLMINENTSMFIIAIISALTSIGIGCLSPITVTIGIGELVGKDRTDGSSVMNMFRLISSSLASIIAVLVYSIVLQLGYDDYFSSKMAYLYMSIVGALLIVLTAMYYIGKKKTNNLVSKS